jgi:hypothetical protein
MKICEIHKLIIKKIWTTDHLVLGLKINNLFLIDYYHREHREMVRKMRDLVRILRKYTLIFLSVLSVFSVVKIQRE